MMQAAARYGLAASTGGPPEKSPADTWELSWGEYPKLMHSLSAYAYLRFLPPILPDRPCWTQFNIGLCVLRCSHTT